MSRRGLALAVAAALAGCGGSPPPGTPGWRRPSSIVAFWGMTHRRPGQVWPYLAIANRGGSDVRLLDPQDDRAVPSPGFAYALSIPTDPEMQLPDLVAAARLQDAGASKPDVLVAASTSGPAVVQVISTWEDGADPETASANRVVATLDLSDPAYGAVAAPGTQILSMIGGPVFAGSPPQIVPERARIYVALSAATGVGPRIAILEFGRAGDQAVGLASKPVARSLGFDCLSLAVRPAGQEDPYLYCATLDVITDDSNRSVNGVAELDTTGADPAAWKLRGLDAKGPTTLVAAATVRERLADNPNAFGDPVVRAYAWIDRSACGLDQPIDCGIVTLDATPGGPAALAPDFAPVGTRDILPGLHTSTSPSPDTVPSVPQMRYREPIHVPTDPLALVVGLPPAAGAQQRLSSVGNPVPTMRLAPATGEDWTGAAGTAPAADGNAYVVDVSRANLPNDASILRAQSQYAGVQTAQWLVPTGFLLGTDASVGLWTYPVSGTPAITIDPNKLLASIGATPGFTTGDNWSVVWQGVLPGLSLREGVVGTEGADVFVAIQYQDETLTWRAGANLDDPRLGVHVGDVVQILPADPAPCGLVPGSPLPEATVTGMLAPTAAHPGSALVLGPPAGAIRLDPCVVPTPADDPYAALITVRASGLVVTADALGYAGRAQFDQVYALAWQDEDPLVAQCPYVQQPPATHDAAFAACDPVGNPGCRAACESLVLARKARRIYYSSDFCGAAALACPAFPGMTDPNATGPLVAFRPGLYLGTAPEGAAVKRDARVTFTTRSGVSPMYRRPAFGSPGTWAAALDRSGLPNHVDDGTSFYVTFSGDTVLEFTPGQSAGALQTIR